MASTFYLVEVADKTIPSKVNEFSTSESQLTPAIAKSLQVNFILNF